MNFTCPAPYNEYERILLAHGSGGRLSDRLIHNVIVKILGDTCIDSSHDGALLSTSGTIAFTTDSFVVDPVFFPGGNIGDLAVNGTVNDLVCCGAVPMYLSLSLIIEEGLSMREFVSIMESVAAASRKAGVKIVTGDTKVVGRGKGDKIFINTAGVGEVPPNRNIAPHRAAAGDAIIITGNIADHGIAILSTREGLSFETDILSDSAPLNELAHLAFSAAGDIHVLRDPTRGGIASALNEISTTSGMEIVIDESLIPVDPRVRGACEIMGFDPLYIASEGRMLIILPDEFSDGVVKALQTHPLGINAAVIGYVSAGKPGVKLKTMVGSTRIVEMITGEQLPRIC